MVSVMNEESGTDSEINEVGWLGFVSITIVVKFKDKVGSLAECWPSLLSVRKHALPLEKF